MGFLSMVKAMFKRKPDSPTVDLALAMSHDVAREARELREHLQPYLEQRDPLMAFVQAAYNKREGVSAGG